MSLVSARLAKDPVDVVAIGTLFQQAPTSYISITDPGAPPPKPKDMEGKTVGVQAGTEFMFHAFAKKNGIDESKVKLVTAQATVEPLMVGKMDYFLAWIVNQTYQIEQESAKPDAPPTVKGKTWRALRMSEWGIALLYRRDLRLGRHAQEESRAGAALPQAVQRGMQYVIDHPDESVEFLAKVPGPGRGPEEARLALQDPEPAVPERGQQEERPALDEPGGVGPDDRLPQGRRPDPKIIPAAEVMTNEFLAKK